MKKKECESCHRDVDDYVEEKERIICKVCFAAILFTQ